MHLINSIKSIPSALDYIETIIKRSDGLGIVTFASNHFTRTFDYDPKTRIWGYDERWRALLLAKLVNALSEPGSGVGIMLRTFTKKTEKVRCPNGKNLTVPVKELRGYSLKANSKRIEFRQCTQSELFDSCNTDADTGKPMTPELAVVYCES
jgi:hypothetical protein